MSFSFEATSKFAVNPNDYAMSLDRAKACGFVSHYNHTGNPATDLLANDLSYTHDEFWRLVTNPISLQVHLSGYGGIGFDFAALPTLLPCTLWVVFFLIFRSFCQKKLFRFGLYLQVVEPKRSKLNGAICELTKAQRNKLQKFQNQLWLAVFYTVSSIFGYMIQRDMPWFGLPLTEQNYIHFLTPHPYKPGSAMLHYYQYGLGFYTSEMVTLLLIDRHMKRSDFLEYAAHHVITMALMILSHCGYEHRVGAYVLFIHDASDIMLAVSKSLHYVVSAANLKTKDLPVGKKDVLSKPLPSMFYALFVNETVVNMCFALFIALFIFFRLVCLPLMAVVSVFVGLRIRPCTWNHWILTILLQVGLQGLHVYWFALIVKMVFSLLSGNERKDIRSDDDDDDDEVICTEALTTD